MPYIVFQNPAVLARLLKMIILRRSRIGYSLQVNFVMMASKLPYGIVFFLFAKNIFMSPNYPIEIVNMVWHVENCTPGKQLFPV